MEKVAVLVLIEVPAVRELGKTVKLMTDDRR
jgi:hypothetical protein